MENHKKRSTYLPRLCSSATIKDVHLPKSNHLSFSSSSSSSSFSDPSSPRVGCMGQIKTDTNSHYKFISSTKTVTSHKVKGNLPRRKSMSSTTITKGQKCNVTSPEVDISKMDPPLPVVKRVKDPGFNKEEVNLWKRRIEFASKNLELSPIDVPKDCYHQPMADDGDIRPSLKPLS